VIDVLTSADPTLLLKQTHSGFTPLMLYVKNYVPRSDKNKKKKKKKKKKKDERKKSAEEAAKDEENNKQLTILQMLLRRPRMRKDNGREEDADRLAIRTMVDATNKYGETVFDLTKRKDVLERIELQLRELEVVPSRKPRSQEDEEEKERAEAERKKKRAAAAEDAGAGGADSDDEQTGLMGGEANGGGGGSLYYCFGGNR
jgi:hypothetical protein